MAASEVQRAVAVQGAADSHAAVEGGSPAIMNTDHTAVSAVTTPSLMSTSFRQMGERSDVAQGLADSCANTTGRPRKFVRDSLLPNRDKTRVNVAEYVEREELTNFFEWAFAVTSRICNARVQPIVKLVFQLSHRHIH